jgi:hypothetical protein
VYRVLLRVIFALFGRNCPYQPSPVPVCPYHHVGLLCVVLDLLVLLWLCGGGLAEGHGHDFVQTLKHFGRMVCDCHLGKLLLCIRSYSG